jgi:hypothetical protein
MAGNSAPIYPSATPSSPTALFGNPATFTAAANTQASDYDTIMKSYSDILAKSAANPLTSQSVTSRYMVPQTSNYQQSADVTGSLANLSDLATTGGYSAQGIEDIRARDIAPTRGIYAQAQQEAERAKALGGGYSPNFNAAQAQMARDESNQISNIDTAANAGIAQNVASNRIAAASPYAAASSSANAAKTAADARNADIINQINMANEQNRLGSSEFNSAGSLQAQTANKSTALGATGGQTSLYGTTPALTKTFGDQTMQATGAGQSQQQIDQQKQRDLFSLGGRV